MPDIHHRYSRVIHSFAVSSGISDKPMSSRLITYPAIPQDTLQAASSLYGKGNVYLKLGDHLDELLLDLIPPDMKPCRIRSKSLTTTLRYAMLTIFQFTEELADQQILEALRNRVELKYAVHLPMNSPRYDSGALCEFRQELFADPVGREIFQRLLNRLVDFGFFAPVQDRPMDALQLLTTVCMVNLLDEVIEAMHRVLESLACTDPDWLRQIALPYWYERYRRGRRWPRVSFSSEKWNTRLQQIAADIQYLLGEIDKSHDQSLVSLQEIQKIRWIWKEHYEPFSERVQNPQHLDPGTGYCPDCRLHTCTKEV